MQKILFSDSHPAGRAFLSEGVQGEEEAGVAEGGCAARAEPGLFWLFVAVSAVEEGGLEFAAAHCLHVVILHIMSLYRSLPFILQIHNSIVHAVPPTLLLAYSCASCCPRIRSSLTKVDLASLALRALRNPRMILRCLRFSDFQLAICARRIYFWVGRSPIVISCCQNEENSFEGSSFSARCSLR